MPGAGHEANAQAFDVVVGVVERVDLEFAAVAGARVDRADAQGAAHDAQDPRLQGVAKPEAGIGIRDGLGDDTHGGDLSQCLQHGRASEVVATVGQVE